MVYRVGPQTKSLREFFPNLNFRAIENSISDSFESYEYLFLLAIMSCIRNRNLQANPLAPIFVSKIAAEMLLLGFFPINNGVQLGPDNRIKKHLDRLGILDSSSYVVSQTGKIRASISSRYRLSDDEVIRYLPSRFLLHFFPETVQEKGSVLRDSRIGTSSRSEFVQKKPLYCLNQTGSLINLEDDWVTALSTHHDDVLRWLLQSWSKTLKDNPAPSLLHVQGTAIFSATQTPSATVDVVDSSGRKTLVFQKSDLINAEENKASRGLEECRLFAGLDPCMGDLSVLKSVKAISETLQAIRQAPRSLCQLTPSRADYIWLCRWAKNFDPEIADHFLLRKPYSTRPNVHGLSNREIIGTIFLLLASETSRREGKEGQVWPTFIKKFSESTVNILTLNNEVGPWVRRSIEQAVYSQGLRNVIGKTGIQYHYLTVFLQFGITKNAIKRIPFWLSGHSCPEAVRYLLSEHSDVRSKTFKQLWETLASYRNQSISESDAKSFCENSPWVLPEWAREILIAAKASTSEDSYSLDEDDLFSDSLEAKKSLIWLYPDPPMFQITADPVNFLDVDDGQYKLKIASKDITTVSVLDGLATNNKSFLCPAESPEITLDLFDSNNEIVKTADVILWDHAEEITAFELKTGQTIDPWYEKMQTSKGYAILSPDHLSASEELDFYSLPQFKKRLWMLPVGWSAGIEFLQVSDIFWSPLTSEKNEDFSLERLRIIPSAKRVIIGDSIDLRVTGLTQGVVLKSVSLAGIQLDFKVRGTFADTVKIPVSEQIIGSRVKVSLRVEYKGKVWNLRRPLAIETVALTTWNGGKWSVDTSKPAILETRDGIERKFKVLATGKINEDKRAFYVFEADQPIAPVRLSKSSLNGLSGYGGELRIRKLYNPQPVDDEYGLQVHVENRGIISSAVQIDQNTIKVNLISDFSTKECEVIIWPTKSAPVILKPEEWSIVDSKTIQCNFDIPIEQIALGISSRGIRIGAYWPRHLASFLSNQYKSTPTDTIAAMIRWLRLPILRPEIRNSVLALLKTSPVEFLTAWTMDTGLPEGAVHAEEMNSWYSAIRTLNQGRISVNTPQAYEILEGLDPTGEDELTPLDFAHCVRELLILDPLIMTTVLFAWAEGTSKPTINQYTHAAICQLLNQPLDCDPKDLDFAFDRLKQYTSDGLRIDPNFVMSVIKVVEESVARTISERDFLNLQVGLSSDSFRKLLAVKILKTLKLIARN